MAQEKVVGEEQSFSEADTVKHIDVDPDGSIDTDEVHQSETCMISFDPAVKCAPLRSGVHVAPASMSLLVDDISRLPCISSPVRVQKVV